ncbi:MAG: hypothetical protein FWF08_00575 [Oscillospiraceae bacterium]|nr:hypothetical protein [Oscillospiraceae bacterium]
MTETVYGVEMTEGSGAYDVNFFTPFSAGHSYMGMNVWIGTRAEYNELSPGERNDIETLYFIKEE